MILAIDIGNTNIVVGCFENDKILFNERVSTNHKATDMEYATTISMVLHIHGYNSSQLTGAIISSVVPDVTNMVKKAIEKYTKLKDVIVVSPGIKTGLVIHIDNPAQLGSDLVVDAVAGINLYPTPQIIIDMGTATTYSVINKQKQYIGGLITCGVGISADTLTKNTSLLSKVAFDAPKKVIGTNTSDCMKSGLILSNACAIDGVVDRIESELGEKCTVIVTGGLAETIVPHCKRNVILDNDLLLKGLMFIYNKNK